MAQVKAYEIINKYSNKQVYSMHDLRGSIVCLPAMANLQVLQTFHQ